MPGSGTAAVKCEPPSDEEDNSPQLPGLFLNITLPSEFHSLTSVKAEVGGHVTDEATESRGAGGAGPGAGSTRSHARLREAGAGGEPRAQPGDPGARAASHGNTPVCVKQEPAGSPALSLETLEPAPHRTSSLLERHMAVMRSPEAPHSGNFTPLSLHAVKDEPTSEGGSDELGDSSGLTELATRGSPKSWTQHDMDSALDALRNRNMSLTKASSRYGIPSTTLWQRAHRLGIDTPKKEGATKSWSEADLRGALHALRAGAISANKASKAYG
ncbi:putative pipsqueak [Operophtera brumata]|uniref:Putative pipsqueak n=1 Tax=Operophtera brumata TaxID=104452 RepID=A0A0L7K5T6_OPEBR|nr:putative pipsqueak [Operophtera brumata]